MIKGKTKESVKSEPRRERPIFGMARDKLAVVFKDPDYLGKWHTVWQSDSPGTIHERLRSGYQFVTKDEIETVGAAEDVGRTAYGIDNCVCIPVDRHGLLGFLMKMPIDMWEADQALRDQKNAEPFIQVRDGYADRKRGQYVASGYNVQEKTGR